MKFVKVGVVGARSRNSKDDKEIIRQILLHRLSKGDTIHLVSGGCPKGADKFAEELSEELSLSISIHYPDESQLPPNHTNADYARICYARNTLIAEECDILLALPGETGGTWDTIRKTEKLGKPVIIR